MNGHQTVTRGLGGGGLRLHLGARCEGGNLPCAHLSGPLVPLLLEARAEAFACGARCPLPGAPFTRDCRLPLASFRALLSVRHLPCHTRSSLLLCLSS